MLTGEEIEKVAYMVADILEKRGQSGLQNGVSGGMAIAGPPINQKAEKYANEMASAIVTQLSPIEMVDTVQTIRKLVGNQIINIKDDASRSMDNADKEISHLNHCLERLYQN